MNPKLFNKDYLLHLCQKFGLKPSKEYGQNYLLDAEVVETMVEAGEVTKKDTVIEVGPGFGVLTLALAEKAGKVVAFEIEKKLQKYWASLCHSDCHPERGVAESKDPLKFENQGISPLTLLGRNDNQTRGNDRYENLQIIWGNVLREFSNDVIARSATTKQSPVNQEIASASPTARSRNDSYKVIANLPYQITSNVIRLFLELENPPSVLVTMVQKEVAERICAKPGDMSLLALSVQFYADAEIVATVPRTLFWPEPAVDSAVIKITPHASVIARSATTKQSLENKEIASASPTARSRNDMFFHLIKAGFAQKRKLLSKNLLPIIGKEKKDLLKAVFLQLGLLETVRAQELSLEQWKELVIHLCV